MLAGNIPPSTIAATCNISLADIQSTPWCAQVLKESAARITSSPEVSPSKAPEAADDRAALVKELADVKKRFLAVAKKKQADFAKRVRLLSFARICTCCCPVSRETSCDAYSCRLL